MILSRAEGFIGVSRRSEFLAQGNYFKTKRVAQRLATQRNKQDYTASSRNSRAAWYWEGETWTRTDGPVTRIWEPISSGMKTGMSAARRRMAMASASTRLVQRINVTQS